MATKPTVVVDRRAVALPWARDIPGVDAIDPLLTLRGLALLKREMMALPKWLSRAVSDRTVASSRAG